jgi:hypothetical protein
MKLNIFLLVFLLFSCADIPDSELQLQPTEMKVRVIDEKYANVAGADVFIFRDRISFETRQGYVDKQVTDANGFALFTDLEPYNYFVYATHKDGSKVYDNSENYFILYDYLTENALTTITVKTDLKFDNEPEAIEIESIDFIPMNENDGWVRAYDTLWVDIIIVEDYNYDLDWSEQTIVAREEYLTFKGKPKYGEIQYSAYPWNPDTYENLEIDLTNLELDFEDPDDPETHSYTLYITYFTKESDFDNRELIYVYEEFPVGEMIEDEYSLAYDLDDALLQEIPYPSTMEIGETYDLQYDYKILLNVTWK